MIVRQVGCDFEPGYDFETGRVFCTGDFETGRV